ncbi:MAG: hypothetical protein WCR21_06970 [Bacteroidota bacterium]
MKTRLTLFISCLLILQANVNAQSNLIPYKAGHIFDISLPEYMSKTFGLNNAATIQYKSVVKDVYGFVILDTKEELKLAEMTFVSINDFYDNFIKDFLKDEKKRRISRVQYQKIEEVNFAESDASYYDNEAKTEIYYLVGIVETKNAFYKVLSWASIENKDKFKADFQKILYSIKD